MLLPDFIKNFNKKNKTDTNPGYIIDDSDKNTLFEKTETKLGKFANYTIIFFILLSILLIVFESVGENATHYLLQIFICDMLISVVFGIEYLYRFMRSDHKMEFPFRISNIFDLVSFLPFFILLALFGIGSYAVFAIFRIFRIFKIFELFQKMPIIIKLFRGMYNRRLEYQTGIVIISTIVLFFSTIIYYIENHFGNSEIFHSIPAAIWWAFVTLSTVGYGDMIPETIVGKSIGVILMMMGPILIAILSSITILVFMESTRIVSISKKFLGGVECTRCETYNGIDHKYCKNCGELLDDN